VPFIAILLICLDKADARLTSGALGKGVKIYSLRFLLAFPLDIFRNLNKLIQIVMEIPDDL
jgi:hypothetical protein